MLRFNINPNKISTDSVDSDSGVESGSESNNIDKEPAPSYKQILNKDDLYSESSPKNNPIGGRSFEAIKVSPNNEPKQDSVVQPDGGFSEPGNDAESRRNDILTAENYFKGISVGLKKEAECALSKNSTMEYFKQSGEDEIAFLETWQRQKKRSSRPSPKAITVYLHQLAKDANEDPDIPCGPIIYARICNRYYCSPRENNEPLSVMGRQDTTAGKAETNVEYILQEFRMIMRGSGTTGSSAFNNEKNITEDMFLKDLHIHANQMAEKGDLPGARNLIEKSKGLFQFKGKEENEKSLEKIKSIENEVGRVAKRENSIMTVNEKIKTIVKKILDSQGDNEKDESSGLENSHIDAETFFKLVEMQATFNVLDGDPKAAEELLVKCKERFETIQESRTGQKVNLTGLESAINDLDANLWD